MPMSSLIFKEDGARRMPRVEPFNAFMLNNFEENVHQVPRGKEAFILSSADAPPVPPAFDLALEQQIEIAMGPAELGKRPRQGKDALDPRIRALVEGALKKADMILQEAREEAASILDAARRQTIEIEAQSYQAGFEQGESAGKQLGEQKVEPVLRNLRGMIESLDQDRAKFIASAEADLTKAAVLIALRLAHREIRQDPSIVMDSVRAGMARIRRATLVVIRASPQDYKYLEDHMGQLQKMLESEAAIRVEADEGIPRGGCRIVCDTGEVDATIQAAMDQMRDHLFEDLEQE